MATTLMRFLGLFPMMSLFSFGILFNVFSKDNKNQNSQNQSQSKSSSAFINKFIKLIYCHLLFLSKTIAKPNAIIVKDALHVNCEKDVATGIDKNQAAAAFTIKPEYTLKAALEKITFFINNQYDTTYS